VHPALIVELQWLYTILRDLDARSAAGQAQRTTQQLRDEYRAAYVAQHNAPAHTPAQVAELQWRYPALLDLDARVNAGQGNQSLTALRASYLTRYTSERHAPARSSPPALTPTAAGAPGSPNVRPPVPAMSPAATPLLAMPPVRVTPPATRPQVSSPPAISSSAPLLSDRQEDTDLAQAGDAGDDDLAVVGTTIRFFISSTFADFQTERTVLQQSVFPELRRLCAQSGFRLQPIDLRWGVSEEAGTDRQTLRICFDELERCRSLSPDFFLLIQLGNRYGSHILPPEVPGALVSHMISHFSPEERRGFDAAYRLDENAVPPAYVLLRAEGPEQTEDEALHQALVRASRAAGLSEVERSPFEASATHREIQVGLLGQPAGALRDQGALCAVRRFAWQPNGPDAQTFVERDDERAARVRALTETVLGRLPPAQVLRYEVDWRDGEGPVFDETALARSYLGLLRPKIEAVIAARTKARAAAAAQGRDETAIANTAFEAERAARVEGRELELARLATYLAGKSGSGPLVVTGAAGSGKSTLLAEAAKRAAAAQPGATVLARYIGVTPSTGSLVELLNDLRRAIARACSQPEPVALSDENQVVGAVAAQLSTPQVPAERPLLLVLDALDQLGAHTQRTDWLPRHLGPQVRVVISVLSDRPELDYLSSRLPTAQVLTLAPLSREVGRALLRDLLAAAPQRTLTSGQEAAVLDAFATQGLPLYLRLLAGEARRWRSFDQPRLELSGTTGTTGVTAPLPASTAELLRAILERLEARKWSGRALVARSLGDLAAARFGVAEDELLDLLARDDAVREAQRVLSPNSPPIDEHLPLPVALWARLYAEVEPLLTEREADDDVRLYTFYHQQLRAAVEARYLAGAERVERHRALADYFAAQPWRLGPRHWNWRKVRELVTQQERAGDRSGAEQALAGLADDLEQASHVQGDAPAAIGALFGALFQHLTTGGYWRVGERFYRQALAITREAGNRRGEGIALLHLGILAKDQGRPQEAARYYEQALAIARELGNRNAEGMTLGNLGILAKDQDRPDEAERYYEQALPIFRELGDRAQEGIALLNLGVLAARQGRLQEAARYYEQALAIARELGNRSGEASVLGSLGNLAKGQGRPDEAVRYYEQALPIFRELSNRRGEGNTLLNLGNLADDQGRPQEAARYYEQALAIARELGNRSGEGIAVANLGVLAARQGRPQEAARYYEQALPIFEAIGAVDRAATVRAQLEALTSSASEKNGPGDASPQAPIPVPVPVRSRRRWRLFGGFDRRFL
jgi:tetratricopeptide (TPR) repeat protein